MQKIIYFLLILSIVACASEKELPNTPETVAKQWQEYIDNNHFDEAKELSTEQAIEMVNMIQSVLYTEVEEEVESNTVFKEMICSEKGTKAICTYIIVENDEEIRDSFFLQKENNQWLVDIPAEEELLKNDPIEKMSDDFEKLLNGELQ